VCGGNWACDGPGLTHVSLGYFCFPDKVGCLKLHVGIHVHVVQVVKLSKMSERSFRMSTSPLGNRNPQLLAGSFDATIE
jgi:hypothetical protein